MKIDFHTKYNKENFKEFCEKAIERGLDAVVMSGLDENKDRNYKSLKIFSAEEVEWIAALEHYKSLYDYLNDIPNFITKTYKGKALILLPSEKTFLKDYDRRLYELLKNVSKIGGITISLHENENSAVPMAIDNSEYVYPFDAIRIRPYNSLDIHSIHFFGPIPVAGSGSSHPEDFDSKCVFTYLDLSIKTKNELIDAIKKRVQTKLYIIEQNKLIDFNETISPIKVNEESIRRFIDKIFDK